LLRPSLPKKHCRQHHQAHNLLTLSRTSHLYCTYRQNTLSYINSLKCNNTSPFVPSYMCNRAHLWYCWT
jgi:hypothetical protein